SWSNCGLFLLSAAVTGQVVLEQHPRELSVDEGKEVTFQCSMGRYFSMRYMYWYRQGPSGCLKFIYRDGDIYGEGFHEHFVGSVESSRTTLQI
ncbi:KVD20 protein, partial [Certhia brachydactyla]|nr:KVD20 protein [Certhia familiaris]NXP01274.1 KVD20 protein [Certhia brachydactyla]